MSNKPKLNIEALKTAIEIVGGVSSLSAKSDVSYQSIMDWKSGRRGLSPLNCLKIEKATEGKVKREDILPDYPWEKFNSEEKQEEKLKSEIARNLLAAGVDIDTIAKTTGISVEELEKIQIKNKGD